MAAKAAGGKDDTDGAGKTLEEVVREYVAPATLEAALIVAATASSQAAKGKTRKKGKAAAKKGAAKKAASKKGNSQGVRTGEHGEIILPAEVTEGKSWFYEGQTQMGTKGARQQGGRRKTALESAE